MSSVRIIGFATAAVVLILMQFAILSAALDFVTSFILFGIGFAAGKFSK